MFNDKPKDDIITFFKNSNNQVFKYKKNDIIAIEGDPCESIGVVVSGTIDLKREVTSNSTVHIATINKGEIFGEVIVFSNVNKYPATVFSATNTEIMFVSKNEFLEFCTYNKDFLDIFLNNLSTKIIHLNNSITNLSFTNIRQKICHFLIKEYNSQKTNYIELSMTKKKLSEILGIPRPSLSREFINLKNLGVIDYSKDFVKIIDIDGIKKFLEE